MSFRLAALEVASSGAWTFFSWRGFAALMLVSIGAGIIAANEADVS